MKLTHILYGISTFIPGFPRFRAKGTGGTDSARYCYSVWLRHLLIAKENELDSFPKVVAELGPGDSLGIGLAALISGSEQYFAFDVVEHFNTEKNLLIFDELVELFKRRVAIPDENELPRVKPYLTCYDFPSDILNESRLRDALQEERINKIRDEIRFPNINNELVSYKVPWYDTQVLEKGTVDMIFSQAVLEHVDDLDNTYKSMKHWLSCDGYISHQIDFKCHGTSKEWNGHWACSDFVWKLIRGKQAYLLNREPLSVHISLLNKFGFNVVCTKKIKSLSSFTKTELSPQYQNLSEDDLTTSGAFFQATLRS